MPSSTLPPRVPPPLLSPETTIPDLLRAHPEARPVLDRHGLTGCGGPLGPVESLRFFARAHGVDEAALLDEVRLAIGRAERGEPAPAPEPPSIADAIYRRYFTAAIVVALTAGATWGAWLLWRIGFAGSFTSLSVHEVNAHGEAQVFGWVGLFVMGFAYQAFPRMWHVRLAAPRLAAAALVAMLAGIALRTAGMTAADLGPAARLVALAGGALETAAIAAFVAQMLATFRRSPVRAEPWVAFVLAGLGFFVLQAVGSVLHTWATMSAGSTEELVRLVATWQAPLRDVQVHGLALFMVLGVSIRMLPALFGVAEVPAARARRAFALLLAGVLGETALFVAYRLTGNHALAAGLLLPWALLAAGAALVALPWKPWRPFPQADRSSKFVRAAYGWLAVSLAMLLLLPAWLALTGQRFSHAWHGATRHAITVGFVSLMILGMGAKVVATLNGRDPRTLPSLWGPFLLANVGCFLRVATQSATDLEPAFFRVVGVSGTLEVAALAWWGAHLLSVMRRGKREARAALAAALSQGAVPAARTGAVRADDLVVDLVARAPATLEVFRRRGFAALSNPVLRATLARGVSVADAARFRGVPLEPLLADLDAAVGEARSPAATDA